MTIRMSIIGLLVLLAAVAEAAEVSFALAKPGNVSAAIYDAQGRLVRPLLTGQPLPAGKQRLSWDGLDSSGKAMPAGEYEWRMLRNDGLEAEYLLSVGANPGWAPYGMWVGSHGPVSAVAVDGAKARLYIGALSAENCPVVQCISLDGKTLYWQSEALSSFKGAQRLAVRGGRLYLLQNDGWLYDLDTDAAPNKHIVKKWDVLHPNEARPNTKLGFLPTGHEPDGLAVHEKFIAISHPSQNSIRWHHPESKELLREEKLPGVHGLAVLENGTLIAATGSQVWRIPFPTGKPEPLLKDATLTAAARVAVDEKRDALWVAEEDTSHTIRRYRLSTGERNLLLGSKEGRPFGKFDPLQWRDLKDITCDGQGGIITVEVTPRRVAHFAVDQETPRLINQWFGGQRWGNMTAIDPADPTIAYVNGGSFNRARVRMDFAKRTWEMEAVYDCPPWASRQEGKAREDAPFPSLTHHDAQWQVLHRGKESYLVSLGGHSCSHAPAVVRIDLAQNRLVPVACGGIVRPEPDGSWPDWLARLKSDLPKAGGKGSDIARFAYTWSDVNGDGQLQDSEFRITKAPDMVSQAHGWIDANWNVTMPAPIKPGVADQPVGVILKNLATDPHAAPQWDWTQTEPTIEKLPPELSVNGHPSVVGLYRDETGSLTIAVRTGHPVDDRQGDAWPGNTVATARVVRFNPDGSHLWSAGKHGSVNEIAPGEFQYPKRVMGSGHGCVFIQDRAVRVAQAWTTDGLYAGNFTDRHADDGLPFEKVYRIPLAAHGPENFLFDQIGGSVVTAANGEIFWNPVGRNSSPVFRIKGWDGWERQSGRIRLDKPAPAARADGIGLRGRYFANIQWEGAPVVTRTDAQLWFGNRLISFSQDKSGRTWIGKKETASFDLKTFSARWEGTLEAPLSEAYQFVLEYDEGSTARLWIDGQLSAENVALVEKIGKALTRGRQVSQPQRTPVPASPPEVEDGAQAKRGKRGQNAPAAAGEDQATMALQSQDNPVAEGAPEAEGALQSEGTPTAEETPQAKPAQRGRVAEGPPAKTRRVISEPLPMTAGSRHEIKVDYANSGDGRPQMHLNWQSATQERQHVPASMLSAP